MYDVTGSLDTVTLINALIIFYVSSDQCEAGREPDGALCVCVCVCVDRSQSVHRALPRPSPSGSLVTLVLFNVCIAENVATGSCKQTPQNCLTSFLLHQNAHSIWRGFCTFTAFSKLGSSWLDLVGVGVWKMKWLSGSAERVIKLVRSHRPDLDVTRSSPKISQGQARREPAADTW
ncbi:hypothetical protein RRG08_021574 [Elysia crispata]|uniref:Uncharacterized protein n=1 Tax=Elysia crispata TaxID=231223 RepID=A0AAE0XDP4_9GAST|nr:hypothetical protein RRG08_021574 [Elysia crispata]